MSETGREEMNEQVVHHCEQLWSIQWELLRDCGECISKLSTRDKGEKHSPIDFHPPITGGSLWMLTPRHLRAVHMRLPVVSSKGPRPGDKTGLRHTWNEVSTELVGADGTVHHSLEAMR